MTITLRHLLTAFNHPFFRKKTSESLGLTPLHSGDFYELPPLTYEVSDSYESFLLRQFGKYAIPLLQTELFELIRRASLLRSAYEKEPRDSASLRLSYEQSLLRLIDKKVISKTLYRKKMYRYHFASDEHLISFASHFRQELRMKIASGDIDATDASAIGLYLSETMRASKRRLKWRLSPGDPNLRTYIDR